MSQSNDNDDFRWLRNEVTELRKDVITTKIHVETLVSTGIITNDRLKPIEADRALIRGVVKFTGIFVATSGVLAAFLKLVRSVI